MDEKPEIKVIVGLGNPGHRYELTRHNVGFLFLDFLADKFGSNWTNQTNFEEAKTEKLKLIKPQTFMNKSGIIFQKIMKGGAKPENCLVVHDELEKPFGKVNIKLGGSARGHNGLRSIIENIGYDFYRLRIGIGRPEKKDDVSNYVLNSFSEQEISELEYIFENALGLIEENF